MRRARKPRVLTRCVANYHASPQTRIVEFSAPDIEAGGLIAFRTVDRPNAGRPHIQITIYSQNRTRVYVTPKGTR